MNKENLCEASKAESCGGRREFLVRTSTTAGGLLLTLAGVKAIAGQDKKDDKKPTDAADELVLRLKPESPLSKVGGSDSFSTNAGKVIVIRTTETNFVAFAAKCPHKNGPIEYDAATKQMFCPWHGSRFDTAGAVVKGPAKTGLPAYGTENAVVVKLKS